MHFHPVFGAIIIPTMALGALMIVPYLRFDSVSEGVWFRSYRGRKLAVIGLVNGLIGTILLVLIDEYLVDLPALLPSLPTIISNGWIPMTVLLLMLIGYHESMRHIFKATKCEARQSVFVLLTTSFVVLTIIGIAFRGEGMALMWPWEV